jgi:SagB-type dehydrogenase family enzyme
MLRKRFNVSISLALLVVVVVTFLTGFVAAALDLNRFALHKYAAYAAIGLAAIHVVLHWRSLTAQVRRWLLGLGPPAPPGGRTTPRGDHATPTVSRRHLLSPGLALAAGTGLGYLWAVRTAPSGLQPGQDLGQVYHQWSTPTYLGLLTKSLHVRPQPPLYKTYPDARVVALPVVSPIEGPPLAELLNQRRSVRAFSPRPVTLTELSHLLHMSTGITDRRDPTLYFRSIPSSGALYPLEVYPILFAVDGATPGVYHYDVLRHRLELLRAGDFRQEVFQAAVAQEMVLHCALVLVITGMFSRVHFKYVDRSYRYMLLEAGHLGQNVYLAATTLGLGPCGVGAFFDDDLNRLIDVDGWDETTVYLLTIGPRPT